MKMRYYILITLIFASNYLFAQDIIIKKSQEEIKAKIFEINPTVVKYFKYENLEGPVYIIPKSDISMIIFENGTKEIMSNDAKNKQVSKSNKLINSIVVVVSVFLVAGTLLPLTLYDN
jgi:hypothetical protein